MIDIADELRAAPKGRHRCLLIDPPSFFSAGTKGRPQHYPRMRDHELARLPVGALAHPDGCWLWLWCTSPKVHLAFMLAEEWGFKYSSRGLLWVKTTEREGELPGLHMGMGYTTRKNAEDCWLFRRGQPKRNARDVSEIILAPVREHSRKPDVQYSRIQRFCSGPRIELFARKRRPGWDCLGNEVDKFSPPKEAV